MENKRKANGAAPMETDDRSSKRRKVSDFNLKEGESPESTTAYGLSFLEQIRRTSDKSGRRVATYFEKLPSRERNAEYYKKTRMPISLGMIEKKLDNGEFDTLAELESYFKRMIANAKEFYSRSDPTFEDAERLRKALSNHMTRTNPAYQDKTYQAIPTALPPEGSDDEEAEEGAGGEEDEEEDAEAEDNEEVVEEDEEKEEGGDDEEEEEEQEVEEEEQEEDEAEEEEDEEDEEEEEEEDEEEEEPASKRRSIILKRRGPGRPPKNPRASPKKTVPPDHEYKNVPYKGLSFQQAQEKIIEELIRHEEPEYEGAYFEPFINLPPRALKDYFKVITDPLSFKKFQKAIKGAIKGYRGRGGATSGTSEFKTWNAFEEKAKLLWTNAYFYNEEGSEIYALAQELEKYFGKELKKAQAAVSEPSQPKIKLKVGQTADSTPTPKKITIHVGGRGDSDDSAAPQAAALATDGPVNGQVSNGATAASTPAPAATEKPAAASVMAPSPSPSVPAALKAEESSAASPAVVPRPPSVSSGQATPGAVKPPIPVVPPQPFQHNPLANGYMEQKRLRGKGKGVDDALISRVRLWPPPTMSPSQYAPITTVLPSPKEMQTSATVNLTPAQSRVLIATLIPDHLRNRQYSLWTMVNKQPVKATVNPIPGMQPLERCFEVHFHAGINVIETHLIAAVPRSERVPGGPEVELEVFTIFVNVLRV